MMSSISAFEIVKAPFFAYVFRNTITKSWLTIYEICNITVKRFIEKDLGSCFVSLSYPQGPLQQYY